MTPGIMAPTADLEAKHLQTVAALERAHARLRNEILPRIETLRHAAVATVPLLGPLPSLAAGRAFGRLHNDLSLSEQFIKAALVPAHLPLDLWRNGVRWTEVRGTLSGVAGDLAVTNREIHVTWQGAAADAYNAVVLAHAAAAGRLGDSADVLQFANSWAAHIAATYYTALLAAVSKAVADVLMALAGLAAGPVGIALVAIKMIVGSSLINELTAIANATVDTMYRARVWTTDVLSELRNYSTLPAGQWPQARTSWYSDATVTDGDADWSVRT